MSARVGSMGLALPKGITPAGSGKAGQPKEVVWSILGHTYWLKASNAAPPFSTSAGTSAPPPGGSTFPPPRSEYLPP